MKWLFGLALFVLFTMIIAEFIACDINKLIGNDEDEDDTAESDDNASDDDDYNDDDGSEHDLTGTWTDPKTGLMWENPPVETSFWLDFHEAVNYCDDLALVEYNDWRLPSISELRSIVKGCPGTMTGGPCGVTDSCTAWDCWDSGSCFQGCEENQGPAEGGCYWVTSLIGGCGQYWSNTQRSDEDIDFWTVNFVYGYIWPECIGDICNSGVRCVRNTD